MNTIFLSQTIQMLSETPRALNRPVTESEI